MSNVRKFLSLSTTHLPRELMDSLSSQTGVVAHMTEYGALMYVPSQDEITDAIGTYEDAKAIRASHDDEPDQWLDYTPREILRIWQHACNLGCDYVLFDGDAETDPTLQTWDW